MVLPLLAGIAGILPDCPHGTSSVDLISFLCREEIFLGLLRLGEREVATSATCLCQDSDGMYAKVLRPSIPLERLFMTCFVEDLPFPSAVSRLLIEPLGLTL